MNESNRISDVARLEAHLVIAAKRALHTQQQAAFDKQDYPVISKAIIEQVSGALEESS